VEWWIRLFCPVRPEDLKSWYPQFPC